MDTRTTSNSDIFAGERPERPGMLNTLTILTFIGCGLSYLGTIWNFISNTPENIEKEREALDKLQDQSSNGMVSKMAQGAIDAMQKGYDNRYLLLVSGLIFTTLCLIGAMRMRKLKKSGFPIYTIGELAPVVISVIVFGSNFMSNITTAVAAFFALLFVILYATQRKHLVY